MTLAGANSTVTWPRQAEWTPFLQYPLADGIEAEVVKDVLTMFLRFVVRELVFSNVIVLSTTQELVGQFN